MAYYDFGSCDRATDVILTRKVSRSRCVRGRSFGLKNGGTVLWVSRGCRADFRATFLSYPAGIGF